MPGASEVDIVVGKVVKLVAKEYLSARGSQVDIGPGTGAEVLFKHRQQRAHVI